MRHPPHHNEDASSATWRLIFDAFPYLEAHGSPLSESFYFIIRGEPSAHGKQWRSRPFSQKHFFKCDALIDNEVVRPGLRKYEGLVRGPTS
jgi:hypothetical protein